MTGIGPHTLRAYERSGLVRPASLRQRRSGH
ncbi:MerR family transcriptional regulator [Paractinoplanes rhizophilus]|uniref:MerR family transcriptional regulator n=1 Tax=Paractinoplanes rhizophilus TaxID=1416877 RepID=A0ABW2HWS0_9ACTN